MIILKCVLEDFLVFSSKIIKDNYPDYALLFAYNHEKEIMVKEQEFMNQPLLGVLLVCVSQGTHKFG